MNRISYTRRARSGSSFSSVQSFLSLFGILLSSITVYASQVPTDYDQYVLELINRGRINPLAEATRYGLSDLNEGVDPGMTITTEAKQPLAFNPTLIDAARNHSRWMLDNNLFSHTGDGGSKPMDRMEWAGYVFTAPSSNAENIAWNGTTGQALDQTNAAAAAHKDLFLDVGIEGRGHRLNLMNPDFKEVGVGIVFGVFNNKGTDFNAALLTENFTYSAGSNNGWSFITGVAWNDIVAPDGFYTPGGEGLGGVTVVATNRSTLSTYKTTTWSSGGYSLALPGGTYDVVAYGAALSGTIAFNEVTVGAKNIKIDLTPSQARTGPAITVFCMETLAGDAARPSRIAGTDFGSVGINKPGVRRTFTVRNGGDRSLILGPVTVPDGFRLIEGLSTEIEPGMHGAFVVRLESSDAGTFGGDIQFSTNDSDKETFKVPITGRVNPAGSGPVVVLPISDIAVKIDAKPYVIDLLRHFDDIGIDGTIVRMTTPLGNIDLELADNVTPSSVANFLNYVTDGDYIDSFFHRAVPGFIVQGGGYIWVEGHGVGYVPTEEPIANEFNNWFDSDFGGLLPGSPLNVRGAVAMAKLGNDPDSATSQWFVNIADNSSNLDNQNGGFTVFANVIRGMDQFDLIVDTSDPTVTMVNAGTPFNELPVINLSGNTLERQNLLLTSAVARLAELSFSITKNDNSSLVFPSISSDGYLTLTFAAGMAGTTTITIRSTATDGAFIENSFQVEVRSHQKGDINHDGAVDLSDLILVLQLLSGAGVLPEDLAIVLSEIDANNDGKLGLEEALYILQGVSR